VNNCQIVYRKMSQLTRDGNGVTIKRIVFKDEARSDPVLPIDELRSSYR